MSWIKRNLFFVIGSAVALVLMGLAGWFLYTKWSLNNEVWTTLNADYDKLKGLNAKNPHPGAGPINNINLAKEQKTQLTAYAQKTVPYFEPIERIPESPKASDQEFSSALSRTVEQLQKAATNAGVSLPENYYFSFQAQNRRISFAAGSTDRLSVQLGEVKTLVDILFAAKINALDMIRRERVSTDDAYGPLNDYLTEKSTTNALSTLDMAAVITSYEVTFKGFSTEVAAVLSGLASSHHGFVVKSANVEPAPYVAPPEPSASPTPAVMAMQMVQPQVSAAQRQMQEAQEEAAARANAAAQMARRYGGGGQSLGGIAARGLGTPGPVYQPPMMVAGAAPAAPKPGGPQTVLDEKLLKITLNLALVKMLPTGTK